MAEPLATFRGEVHCERMVAVPGLTLRGTSAEPPAEPTALAFSGFAPADLPDTLVDARVEHLGGGQYRIAELARSWLIAASAVHLHREVAAQFYHAIPPRRAPWAKRMFWRTVLALGASRMGLKLLRALRR
jgi:hypothetical protein